MAERKRAWPEKLSKDIVNEKQLERQTAVVYRLPVQGPTGNNGSPSRSLGRS